MADRHLKMDWEILKQVQDDALVGGYCKIQNAYSIQEHLGNNDSLRVIHLHTIQSIIEASCRRANGGSASQDWMRDPETSSGWRVGGRLWQHQCEWFFHARHCLRMRMPFVNQTIKCAQSIIFMQDDFLWGKITNGFSSCCSYAWLLQKLLHNGSIPIPQVLADIEIRKPASC